MENKPVSLSTKEIYEFFYKEAEKFVRAAAKAEEKEQVNKAVLFKAMAGHMFGAIRPLFTQSDEVVRTHLPHMMICHSIAEDLKKFINEAPERVEVSNKEEVAS